MKINRYIRRLEERLRRPTVSREKARELTKTYRRAINEACSKNVPLNVLVSALLVRCHA